MPYAKAVRMIEKCSEPDISKEYPGASDCSIKNAKKISKLIYKTYPRLDNSGVLTRMCIFHSEKGVVVEFCNEFGVFTFTCKNNGEIHYYQYMMGKDSPWTQDYESLPDEKEIIRHIKRKRLPYEKRWKTTT